MRTDLCRPFLAFLAVLVASESALCVQTDARSGRVEGTVVDTNRATVSGATVTLSGTDNGLARTLVSSASGTFEFAQLPPGTYRLTASAPGFSDTQAEVSVVVGRSSAVSLSLSPAGFSESITVTAGEVQVQTTSSKPDAIVNERAISELPINGRRFQDFVTLTPAVQVEPQRQQLSLSGQRGVNSNINVDGLDYNQPFFGGIRGGERSNYAYTIPQEAVREFQVVPAGYSSEFGRSTGGIVTVVTKSGSNEFHGTAFYLLRHKELSRLNDFFESVAQGANNDPTDDKTLTAAPTQHQWGASVGGPVVRDRFFLFGAYEQQMIDQVRSVVFDSLASITPGPDTEEAFLHYRSLETPFVQTNDALAILVRGDVVITDSHSFNVRYSHSRNDAENAVNVGDSIFPTTNRSLDSDGTEGNRTHTLVGQLTSVFSDRMVNELRLQYSQEERPRTSNSETPNVTTSIGQFGTRNFLPSNTEDSRFQVADNLSYIVGAHSLKLGGDFSHLGVQSRFGFNQFGAFNFSADPRTILEVLSVGGPTPNRFDTPGVTYRMQIGNLTDEFSVEEAALFVQDSWRITPQLTLTAGLRWEGQFNPTPDASNADLVERVQGVEFPIGVTVDPTQIPDTTDQWAPRVGVAWDPFGEGRTVLRGYGGVYYAHTPLLLLEAPFTNFRNPPGDLSLQLPLSVPAGNPNNTVYEQLRLVGIDLNDYPLNALPVLDAATVQSVAAALGLSPDPYAGANLLVIASDFRNPRSYQTGAGVEHEFLRGLTLGADFSFVNTVRLERNRDVNLPAPVIRPDDPAQRPFYGLRSGRTRPIPSLGAITVREATARAVYKAMTIGMKFQRDWGQASAFYTLSANDSDDDNERSSGGISYADSFDLRPEYNDSNLDRRHQFVSNYFLRLPFGFEVAGLLALRSGRPITADLPVDANEDRGGEDRPFASPGVAFRRNAFRNRARSDVDLRVQRRFGVGESSTLTVSVELFNLFNFENIELNPAFDEVTNWCDAPVPRDCGFRPYSNPNFLRITDLDPRSRTYGQYLSGNNPGSTFQVQMGLRFDF
jgi:hypothetical protein